MPRLLACVYAPRPWIFSQEECDPQPARVHCPPSLAPQVANWSADDMRQAGDHNPLVEGEIGPRINANKIREMWDIGCHAGGTGAPPVVEELVARRVPPLPMSFEIQAFGPVR